MKDAYDKIEEEIDSLLHKRDWALEQFLSILFWKNSSANRIECSERYKLIELLPKVKVSGPEYEEYLEFEDSEKVIELANNWREKIGLPKLTRIRGNLVEVKEEKEGK